MAVLFTRRGKAAVEAEQYSWQKYAVNTAYTTEETTASGSITVSSSSKVYCSSSLALSSDGTTFKFSTSLSASDYPLKYSSYRYFAPSATTSGTAYYCSAATLNVTNCKLSYSKKYERVQTQTQGSYIEDVISTNPAAYPDNGIQDGYWYVKVA